MWNIFPNPVLENITIQFAKCPIQESVHIYSAIGCLIRTITITGATTKVNIADLTNGLYYIRLKNNKKPALKFIKL